MTSQVWNKIKISRYGKTNKEFKNSRRDRIECEKLFSKTQLVKELLLALIFELPTILLLFLET